MENTNRGVGRPAGSFKKKMNQVELEQFMLDSINIILDNHMSYTDYIEYCRGLGMSKNQGNKYWMDSWKHVRSRFQIDKDMMITKHLKKYWDIHDNSIKNKDYNTARQSLNDIGKMLGLNEAERVQVEGTSIKFKFGKSNDD